MEFTIVNEGRLPAPFIRDEVMDVFRSCLPHFHYTLTIRETPATGRVMVEVYEQGPGTGIEPGRLLVSILYEKRNDETYQVWVGSESARTIAPESLKSLLTSVVKGLL